MRTIAELARWRDDALARGEYERADRISADIERLRERPTNQNDAAAWDAWRLAHGISGCHH